MKMLFRKRVAVVAMAAMILTFPSCDKNGPSAQKMSETDSLVSAALDAADDKRLMELCDSLSKSSVAVYPRETKTDVQTRNLDVFTVTLLVTAKNCK